MQVLVHLFISLTFAQSRRDETPRGKEIICLSLNFTSFYFLSFSTTISSKLTHSCVNSKILFFLRMLTNSLERVLCICNVYCH